MAETAIASWSAEDRAEMLTVALQQAMATIEFLHGCLTNPHVEGVPGGFSYGYPEQTVQRLEDFEALVPERHWCVHSVTYRDCEGCKEGNHGRAWWGRMREQIENPGAVTEAVVYEGGRPGNGLGQ